jgi:hypothetical protein
MCFQKRMGVVLLCLVAIFVVMAALAVNGKELHYYAEEGTNE